jgi:hypothetical protein
LFNDFNSKYSKITLRHVKVIRIIMYFVYAGRMQSFEDEIASMFRTMTRVPERPVIRAPIAPESDSSNSDSRPSQSVPSTINLFRPFRPFGVPHRHGVSDAEDSEDSAPGFGLFRPFRPFGSGFFGFRNPAEFPENYHNTTSTTNVC